MIPVAAPVLNGNEARYVNDVLASTHLSRGRYCERFEQAFAAWVGVPHAIATTSGTTALHLALLGLGVQPGDEVIVPASTYIATANAVRYCGAAPVFADVEPCTWCLDRSTASPRITERTVGIIAVHLYGHPAAMDGLRRQAQHHGLWLLEDAAEAHGARDGGKRVGGLADAGVFSFYGNKILTCGEGGMVTTADATVARRVRHLAAACQITPGSYQHDGVGYNYRMTDLQAAVGLAQVERAAWHLSRREQLAALYRQQLQGQRLTFQSGGGSNVNPVHWTMPVLLPEGHAPADVATRLLAYGIETRPFFPPLPSLPPYQDGRAYPEAARIAARGLLLPLHAGLADADVRTVCDVLGHVLAREGVPA
jgi:perosamine synthetase